MIKRLFEYEDFDGITRKEECVFNLSKSEIMQMEIFKEGGLEKKLNKIINAQDAPEIMKMFKEIILMSYGVKSDDGRRLDKSQKLRDEFEHTPMFDMLFMELATDADAAQKFINGIVPKDISEASANKVVALPGASPVETVKPE